MTVLDLTPFAQAEQIGQKSLAIDEASLYREFEKVKDGRGRKGKRYPLALILTLIMLGKLSGQAEIENIIAWINERKQYIKQLFNWPKDFPSLKTYIYALSQCDHREVVKAIAQVILKARAVEQCGEESSRLVAQPGKGDDHLIHTAVDGKLMRGTLKHKRDEQPPVHLLSFYECESGIVLDQFVVESKKNEESMCKAILHPILVKGRILTVDAIFTSREWCALVHTYHGYYLIPIKDNNPAVLRYLMEFFDDEGIDRKEFQYHQEVNKGHGRLEVREIWTSTQMNEFFHKDWAGIAQVYKIRRTITQRGEQRIETIYGVTNLPREKAKAKRLLELNRKHWYIENRLHWRRDVTLKEDASQVRTYGAPSVLAALNGGILALMDWLGVRNVPKQMIHFCAQPQETLQLLLGRLSRQNG